MADGEKDFPLTEEHLEANQYYLDKERYDTVSKLSEAEQAKFKRMEQAVEALIGIGRPFMLLAAPTDSDIAWWRYQKYTEQKVPLSEEEGRKVMLRAWYCLNAHASHFTKMTGHSIVFHDEKGQPYYIYKPEGEGNIQPPTNE